MKAFDRDTQEQLARETTKAGFQVLGVLVLILLAYALAGMMGVQE